MRIFVAGGSGAIGVPLVRRLVSDGHEVTALTRSPAKLDMLRAIGATPVVADALDAAALERVVVASRPSHVIHQLTALPKTGPSFARQLVATNRLRVEGTRNLIRAAIAAGARRVIAGSFLLAAVDRDDVGPSARPTLDALRSMEAQMRDAATDGRIEALVLRYGLFYARGNPATEYMMAAARRRMLPAVRDDRSLLACIGVGDAVEATVAALTRGVSGATYDIVDDQPMSFSAIVRTLAEAIDAPRPFAAPAWVIRLVAPFMADIIRLRVPVSNESAKAALGWQPRFPTCREGLMQTAARAA